MSQNAEAGPAEYSRFNLAYLLRRVKSGDAVAEAEILARYGARPQEKALSREVTEALDALRDVVDFAYQQGYHEHGYPLVDTVASALKRERPKAE